jgi:hypothetical protein
MRASKILSAACRGSKKILHSVNLWGRADVATQLMLKSLFELIGTMMEDPDGYRSDIAGLF